nr:ABC transporter substrate-binding protein [Bacilli bacterium]
MKKRSFFVAALALAALASCQGQKGGTDDVAFPELSYSVETSGEGENFMITDMIGRKVHVVPGSYERVVCIGAGALRLYSYVADLNLLCGVEDIDNPTLETRPKMFDNCARPYFLAGQEVFKTLPSCGVGGPQAQTAEPEKILACHPDIVISEYEDVEKENALQEKLGVPVLTLNHGSLGIVNQSVYSSLYMLGTVFGKQQRAKELIEFHYESAKAVFERTKGVNVKKKAYVAGLGNWGTTDQLMTAQNYDVFKYAHIDNVVSGLPTGGVQKITEEKFLALSSDMEMMVFDAAAVKNIRGKGVDFSTFKAFETGEVYLQLPYNAYYTNVETALINMWFVAKSAYPEKLADVDIAAKANEITLKFNGVALYEQMKALPMSYGGYQKIANP